MSLRPKKRAAKDEEDSKEDVQGRKAARGSCHCCGGMLKRNPDFAKVCGTCGARFHTYDCGNRRGDAGFRDFSKCLRVSHISARIRRGFRPGTGAPHQPIQRCRRREGCFHWATRRKKSPGLPIPPPVPAPAEKKKLALTQPPFALSAPQNSASRCARASTGRWFATSRHCASPARRNARTRAPMPRRAHAWAFRHGSLAKSAGTRSRRLGKRKRRRLSRRRTGRTRRGVRVE